MTESQTLAPARRTLFDIAHDYEGLANLLDELDGTDNTEALEAIEAHLGDVRGELVAKFDNCLALCREWEAASQARAEEAKRLMALSHSDTAKAKRLKAVLLMLCQKFDIVKMDTARFRLSRCQNGGKTPLRIDCASEDLPSEFVSRFVEYRPNEEAIRAALEAGRVVPGVTLAPRGEHLRVR